MAQPIIYGPAYSTYVRTLRMALEEKGVDYKMEEVDLMKGAQKEPAHIARHPFGKVPAFEHDGFVIYETDPAARYIDEAFGGPKLQPSDLRKRARMNQIIAVVDNYAYPAMITSIMIPRVVVPMLGGSTDEAAVAAAKPQAQAAARALEPLVAEFEGEPITLADLYLLPVLEYFAMVPEGKEILPGCTVLQRWLDKVGRRPSAEKTRPKLG